MRMLLRIGRVVRLEMARETTCSAWLRVAGLQVTFIGDTRTLAFKRVVPRT
jgi:hypothetical protein